jgi:ParB-like chromosome segregation protein Spo0J
LNIAEQLPQELVAVDAVMQGPYLREAGTNPVHVQLLADAARSTNLPPILVQLNTKRIIDGMHRLAAAKLRGEKTISACLIDCTDEEALVLAIKANILHGLPLSKADRISGAKRILMQHPDWSDRAVASVTGLSSKTIGVLRNRSSGDMLSFEKRLGRDGKRHPVTVNEGRKRATVYLRANPDASLREVAREADVSVGTVHSVRRLMRYETDHPAPPFPRPAQSPRPERLEQVRRPEQASVRAAARRGVGAPAQQPAGTIAPGLQYVKRYRPVAWSGISVKIRNDPALRYTEGGRAFLQWMAQHALNAEDWRELVSAVPQHWVDDVTTIADSVSAEWRMFAAQLRRRGAAGS